MELSFDNLLIVVAASFVAAGCSRVVFRSPASALGGRRGSAAGPWSGADGYLPRRPPTNCTIPDSRRSTPVKPRRSSAATISSPSNMRIPLARSSTG